MIWPEDYIDHIINNDCLEVLPTLPDNCIDTMITDPPAGIAFMGKEWDKDKGGRLEWIAWLSSVFVECKRVLKPGAMVLVWALPRTSHWTATALEDAGFEIRDKVYHIFGQGFPKSLDISKAIDKAVGAKREVVGLKMRPDGKAIINARPNGFDGQHEGYDRPWKHDRNALELQASITAPATGVAKTWNGWGTALKPAAEEWILAMKPLDGTFAENALKWNCAGLNIDGCRIPMNGEMIQAGTANSIRRGTFNEHEGYKRPWKERDPELFASRLDAAIERANSKGRWPANVILDEETGEMLDEQAGFRKDPGSPGRQASYGPGNYVTYGMGWHAQGPLYYDGGGASRFFYCAKASRGEREAGLEGMEERSRAVQIQQSAGRQMAGKAETLPARNHHPTVKPLALMRYLCRLTATPTDGIVLDPFLGSGTTALAAKMEGRHYIGIEKDAGYVEIARRRLGAILL